MKNEEENIFLSMFGFKKNESKTVDNADNSEIQGITSKISDDEDYIEYWS